MLVCADGIILPEGMTIEEYDRLTPEAKLALVWCNEYTDGVLHTYNGEDALKRINGYS